MSSTSTTTSSVRSLVWLLIVCLAISTSVVNSAPATPIADGQGDQGGSKQPQSHPAVVAPPKTQLNQEKVSKRSIQPEAFDLDKAKHFCQQLAVAEASDYSDERLINDAQDFADSLNGLEWSSESSGSALTIADKLCQLIRILFSKSSSSPTQGSSSRKLSYLRHILPYPQATKPKPKRSKRNYYDYDYGSAEASDSLMKKLDYLFGHEGIRYKRNNATTEQQPQQQQQGSAVLHLRMYVPAGTTKPDLIRELERQLTTGAPSGGVGGSGNRPISWALNPTYATPLVTPSAQSFISSSALSHSIPYSSSSSYASSAEYPSEMLPQPVSNQQSNFYSSSSLHKPMSVPVFAPAPVSPTSTSSSSPQPRSPVIGQIRRFVVDPKWVLRMMGGSAPNTFSGLNNFNPQQQQPQQLQPQPLSEITEYSNSDKIRFVKKNPYDKEGIRFKRASELGHATLATSFETFVHYPFDNEGIRFKKSPFEEEGIRYKKASPFADEGIRYKKAPFEEEGIRFKKSPFEEEGIRYRKSSPFMDEGIRYKKAPFDEEGIRFKKSPFEAEGIRFKKSPFEAEGIRYRKSSPFLDEGIRYKKSPFDAEGIRFKKSPFEAEGIRFKKSPFEAEGIRF